MRLYLSAVFENSSLKKTSKDITDIIDISKVHILQSFIYAKEEHAERYKDCKSFMMDSGAFTLMMSKKNVKNFDIKKFATNYANFIKKWDYISQASNELNICRQDIGKNCLGKIKSAGGYIWKYVEEVINVK